MYEAIKSVPGSFINSQCNEELFEKKCEFASWKELFSKKCEFHCELERIIRESCQNSANEFCLDLYDAGAAPAMLHSKVLYMHQLQA